MVKEKKAKVKFSKEEKSWIAYDWANSVYATIMLAAVFPIYFATVAGEAGDMWWGIGTSAAMIFMALIAPIIGAFSDFPGYRMRVFTIFFVIGVGVTFASAFFNRWELLLLGYAVSHIGFSGANIPYDATLADVTKPERMDMISGYGYAYGYIGGSTIPFLVSIGLIMYASMAANPIIDNILAIRISVVLCAIWWAVFTIPYFKNVKQIYSIPKPETGSVTVAAFKAIIDTVKKIIKHKKVLVFILAYFFYIDGVGTVITMSTVYGTVLGLDATMMILALLITQLVAFPCSIWFSRLATKFGSLTLIRAAVCIYLGICITGFIMGFGLEENLFGIGTATILFFSLAFMVGSVQGGIQAISRSYYCQIIPPENSGEFFGFFEIFGKFAAVLGPLLYAVTVGLTGRSSLAILSIIGLFLAGLIILAVGNKHLKAPTVKM